MTAPALPAILGAIALACTAALATGGCSLMFVKPPPDNYRPGDRVECTTSRGAPVIDTIASAGHVAGLIYLETRSYGPEDKQLVGAAAATGFAGLLLYTASAVKGYLDTSTCAEAVESSRHPPLILKVRRIDPDEPPQPEGDMSPGPGARSVRVKPNAASSNLP